MTADAELQAAGWKARPAGGFMQGLGPLWSRQEAGGRAYALCTGDQHLNPAGLVHGGALVTLADHALSLVAWEAAERQNCVTLQLETHFIAPVRAGMLVEARATIVSRSGALVFMRGQLSVAGQTVLAAQAIVRIVRG